MFEVSKNLSALIASEIFEKRNNVSHLWYPSEFALLKIHNLFDDKKSISYLGPQIWNMVHLKWKLKQRSIPLKEKLRNKNHRIA